MTTKEALIQRIREMSEDEAERLAQLVDDVATPGEPVAVT